MNEWWQTFKDGLHNSHLLLLHPWPVWLVAPLLVGCVALVIYLYDKESLGAQKYEELCREILGLPQKVEHL